jgi:hypothetical protein
MPLWVNRLLVSIRSGTYLQVVASLADIHQENDNEVITDSGSF